MSISSTSHAQARTAREVPFLATLTIAGIVLYVVLDVVAQLLPPHYSPIRQAESDLAVGPYGWIMAINFVLRGLFSLSLLVALWQVLRPSLQTRFGLALLPVWVVGAFVLAANPTDVSGGEHTLHGKVHLALAVLAFICIPIAEELLSRALRATARLTALGGRVQTFAHLCVLGFVIQVILAPSPRLGGLGERIFLFTALLWMLVVAWELHRWSRAPGAVSHSDSASAPVVPRPRI